MATAFFRRTSFPHHSQIALWSERIRTRTACSTAPNLRRRCRLGHSAAAEGLDVDLRDGDLRDGDLRDGDLRDGDLRDGDLRDGDLRDGKLSDGEAPVRPVRHRVSKVRCSS
jgi:hypothetical protein